MAEIKLLTHDIVCESLGIDKDTPPTEVDNAVNYLIEENQRLRFLLGGAVDNMRRLSGAPTKKYLYEKAREVGIK